MPEGLSEVGRLSNTNPKFVMHHTKQLSARGAVLTAALLALLPAAQAETIYGLGSGNFIFSFDSGSPGTATSPVAITGLGSSTLLGIDYRPADGLLYGVGTGDKVFSINPVSGAATDVTAASLLGTAVGGGLGGGTEFGIDFNPVVNRLRIVSDADKNLRIFGAAENVDASLVYQVGDANFGANPNITAVAYTNPDTNPATGTTLYGIDTALNVLVLHNTAPGFQNLQTLGSLGVDFPAASGFDISASGTAYAGFYDPGAGVSQLYTLNLGTGSASLVGSIGGGAQVLDLAAVPEPETYALMFSGALVGFAAWRRSRR